MQKYRKLKVIGFPFATNQINMGSTLTPHWLKSQSWFKNSGTEMDLLNPEPINLQRPLKDNLPIIEQNSCLL